MGKKIQPSEYVVINSQRKCLYASKTIKKGEKFTKNNISIKGPGGGILPKYLNFLINRKSSKNIPTDHPIDWDCI